VPEDRPAWTNPFDWDALYRLAKGGVFRRLPFGVPAPDTYMKRKDNEKDLNKIFYVVYRLTIGFNSILKYFIRQGYLNYKPYQRMVYGNIKDTVIAWSGMLSYFPQKEIEEILNIIKEMLLYPGLLLEMRRPSPPPGRI